MNNQLLTLAGIAIIVAIDNASLAGIVLPHASRRDKKEIMIVVGIALAIIQILLSMGVGQLLSNELFRLVAIGVLVWMSIRTLAMVSFPQRKLPSKYKAMGRVFIYTVIEPVQKARKIG